MSKLIRSIILPTIIVLFLASCSFPFASQNNLIQVTPILPDVAIIELTVQVDTSVPFNTENQPIKYNYTIRNVGTASTLGTSVVITGAIAVCPPINSVGNLDNNFDVNETLICASAYPITKADLDKGSVTTINTAIVNGINSNPVTTTVPTVKPVVLTLTKTADPAIYYRVDQIIKYIYVITNVSPATLGPAQFTVTDTGIGAALINCGDAALSLASTATVKCSVDYKVTQADMNAASVSTSATASGGGAGPSQPASATITKSAIPQPNPNLVAGTTIRHQVAAGEWVWQIARCYGADPEKVSKANPPTPAEISPGTTVIVPNIGSNGKMYGPPCIATYTVISGDTWDSIALKYYADPVVLKMANSKSTLAAGSVIRVPLYSAGSTTPTTPVSNSITLTKTANPATYDQLGQVITYTYVITNTGTTSLGPAQFTVSDNLVGTINCGAANTSLAPNATVTCTAPYAITEANLAAASVSNIATASGGGAGPSVSVSATINKSIRALTLTTSANPTTYNLADQKITFTYVIKNAGNVSLGPAQFTVSDTLIGATPINCDAATITLAPNATVTCTADYVITAANMAAASVSNFATASGAGAGPSQPASATVNKTP